MDTSFISKMDVGSLILYSSILQGTDAQARIVDFQRGHDVFTDMNLDLPNSKEMSAYVSKLVIAAPDTPAAIASIKQMAESFKSLATAIACACAGGNIPASIDDYQIK